jgi:hypothetical protein
MRKLHALALTASLIAPGAAWGEVFVLENEGSVRGELLNPKQSPRETYVVKTPSGGEVTLAASQVKEVVRQSEIEMEYDRVRLRYPDTVEGQWDLAEWCRENKLNRQRTTHLERVIALDSDHVKARHALGYESDGGKWVTRDEKKKAAGYVKYKNEWLLPQEVQLREERGKQGVAQDQWRRNLNSWRRLLETDKRAAALASIQSINDPGAVTALAHNLDDEPNTAVKQLYVEALSKIHTPDALNTLAAHAISDRDEETRLACVERLAAAHYKPAVHKFIGLLKSKDNSLVNRAAAALGHMKDPRAISPLIDALVTTHLFKVVKGQPGQQSHSFGSGPGGGGGTFSFGGGGVELVKQALQNPEALNALVVLSGGSNFGYDVDNWKSWYSQQKKHAGVDARRD